MSLRMGKPHTNPHLLTEYSVIKKYHLFSLGRPGSKASKGKAGGNKEKRKDSGKGKDKVCRVLLFIVYAWFSCYSC